MRPLAFAFPLIWLFSYGCALAVSAKAADCADFLPKTAGSASPARTVTADDLLRLRDIGPLPFADPKAAILSLSPDGAKLAFQMRRADPVGDTYCLGMVVIDLKAGAKPLLVNSGGDLLRIAQDMAGVTDVPSGFTEVVTPIWSPDGKFIAFLRKDGGKTQAWIAATDGATSRAVTHLPYDVEAMTWAPDGQSLVISGRPDLLTAKVALDAEGRSGYLFNDRYIPFASNKPFPRKDVEREIRAVDVSTGVIRPATDIEARLLTVPTTPGVPDTAIAVEPGPSGRTAWTDLSDLTNVVSPRRLHVTFSGRSWTCADKRCQRADGIWWVNRDSLVFERREGWARSETGFYEWRFRSGEVREILKTNDVLFGCQMGKGALVCAHEAPFQPREIVSMDLQNGRMTSLFDPNQEYKGFRLGTVSRLHFTNSFGVEGFADLVLPPDHQPGQIHPLVVVQYESRGFLRGGTGDDFPILLFAANGMAVLRFEDLLSPGYLRGGSSWKDIDSYDRVDWLGHRSTEELLENGLKLSIATGAVDGKRLGITGLSAGSNNVRWALLNSHLFSAAAIGTCCEDMTSIMTTYGEGNADEMRAMGYPGLTDNGDAFWAPFSMRLNARRMKTPLLMQLADNEYLAALESYTALKEQNAPVEMYVFPDEFHEKWHPAHRRAIYIRSVDWFKFWLGDAEDNDPTKAAQYRRWEAMRTAH